MKMFQPILFLLFFWIIVTMMTGASAQTLSNYQANCVFSPYFGDIEQVDMGHHRIYTLFTRHLRDQADDIIPIITTGGSVENKIRRLDVIITQNRDIIQSEQNDVQQITHLIRSEQLSWIGLESSPEEMESFFDYQVESYRQLRLDQSFFTNLDTLSMRWNINKTDQILTLLFPASTLACGTYQKACHEIEQIPLENENLKIEFKNRLQEEKHLLENVFLDLLNRGLMTRHQVEEIIAIGIATIVNDQQPISDDDVKAFFNKFEITNTEVQTHIRAYIDTINHILSAFIRRDQHILASILNSSGHGLVLLGIWHKKEIQEGLIKACQNR